MSVQGPALKDFPEWIDDTSGSANRVRTYVVTARVLMQFLYGQGEEPEFIQVPNLRLPEGCKFLALSQEPMAAAWEVLVWHDSFDPVPEGVCPPKFPCPVEWKVYEVKKPEPAADEPVHAYR